MPIEWNRKVDARRWVVYTVVALPVVLLVIAILIPSGHNHSYAYREVCRPDCGRNAVALILSQRQQYEKNSRFGDLNELPEGWLPKRFSEGDVTFPTKNSMICGNYRFWLFLPEDHQRYYILCCFLPGELSDGWDGEPSSLPILLCRQDGMFVWLETHMFEQVIRSESTCETVGLIYQQQVKAELENAPFLHLLDLEQADCGHGR